MGTTETKRPVHDRDVMNVVQSVQAGFTLIELLIVVAIIGIISAMAIPGLIAAINQARQKKSMAEIVTLSTAIETYCLDFGHYPIVNNGAATDLVKFLSPNIIKIVPVTDGWSQVFWYTSDTGEQYSIVSFGLNGMPDLPYIIGPTRRFVDDIVHSGGQFTQWPEGAQH